MLPPAVTAALVCVTRPPLAISRSTRRFTAGAERWRGPAGITYERGKVVRVLVLRAPALDVPVGDVAQRLARPAAAVDLGLVVDDLVAVILDVLQRGLDRQLVHVGVDVGPALAVLPVPGWSGASIVYGMLLCSRANDGT